MRTDCHALLDTLDAGVEAATAPYKPLARIWARTAHALDGSFEGLRQAGLLVWMPAHCAIGAVGETKLSNGVRLSVVDWRANRLVDALAKAGARLRQAVDATDGLLSQAACVVRHAAQLLGRVTYAANHHEVEELDASGAVRKVVRRDATQPVRRRGGQSGRSAGGDAARGARATSADSGAPLASRVRPDAAAAVDGRRDGLRAAGPAPLPLPLGSRAASAEPAGRWLAGEVALRGPARRAAAARLMQARARAVDEAAVQRLVAAAASRAVAPAGGAAADARWEALRQRVLLRSGGI
jgi:hypothetical protein